MPDASEFRTTMMHRLVVFKEALDMHMSALHRMYNEGALPEKIYLVDLAATRQEIDIIENAIQMIRMHRDSSG